MPRRFGTHSPVSSIFLQAAQEERPPAPRLRPHRWPGPIPLRVEHAQKSRSVPPAAGRAADRRADQADAGQAVQQALFLDDSIRRCREAGRELTVQELCAAYLDFADDYYTKNGRPTGHVPNIRRMIRVIDELYACESL